MQVLDVVFVIAGLVLLMVGGELLVRGASALAQKIGISPLIVGLIVVSAATSAPELAVTVGAVLNGEPGLAVGNVVGSNIINILVILGLSAIVVPLVVKRQLVRFDIPVMIGLSVLLLLVSLDGRVSVLDGLLLLAGLVVHSVLSILVGRREARRAVDLSLPSTPTTAPITIIKPVKLPLALLFLVGGVGLLVLGAQLLVDGAVNIATGFGVSSLVVGLTVVAIGTSLPELAASLAAVRRKETDIAVGNIVGSNIFNIGMVLGVPAMIFGQGIPVPAPAIALDMPLMIAAAVALVPIAFTGFIIARWEGGLFVALYVAYATYLVLAATTHDALDGFTELMLIFVLPLVGITLIVLVVFEARLVLRRRIEGATSSPPAEAEL